DVTRAGQRGGVQLAEQVELVALVLLAGFTAIDVGHGRVTGFEDRALVRGRQEAAVEVVQAAGRDQPAVEHDEAGKVAVRAGEAVTEPGPHARPALHAGPGVQEVVGAGVLGELGNHGPDYTQVVGAVGEVWKESADPQAALAMLRKLPRRGHDLADVVELG